MKVDKDIRLDVDVEEAVIIIIITVVEEVMEEVMEEVVEVVLLLMLPSLVQDHNFNSFRSHSFGKKKKKKTPHNHKLK
jgi:uncharacterized membrane protein